MTSKKKVTKSKATGTKKKRTKSAAKKKATRSSKPVAETKANPTPNEGRTRMVDRAPGWQTEDAFILTWERYQAAVNPALPRSYCPIDHIKGFLGVQRFRDRRFRLRVDLKRNGTFVMSLVAEGKKRECAQIPNGISALDLLFHFLRLNRFDLRHGIYGPISKDQKETLIDELINCMKPLHKSCAFQMRADGTCTGRLSKKMLARIAKVQLGTAIANPASAFWAFVTRKGF